METKSKKERPVSSDVTFEQASRYAQEIGRKYREKIFEDLTKDELFPEGVTQRMMAGTFAIELVDIATDLYMIAGLRAASEAGSPLKIMAKVKEILTDGVDGFSEATKQMLYIAARNLIKKDILNAPEVVNEALAKILQETIDKRESAVLSQTDKE